MEIGEIFSDALRYPLNNIKALIIYVILGIIVGIAAATSLAGMNAGVASNNLIVVIGSGIIGLIVTFFVGFVINGYILDITKLGIERDDASPKVDLVRQFINGVKLFVVTFVYFLIPILISAILAIFFTNWLSTLISIILFIIFAFAAFMGHCRLAKSEDLIYALNVTDAFGDITKVGILKLIIFIIVIFIIAFILSFVGSLISQINTTIGGIIMGIIGVYLTFVAARACGLLYSEV